MCPLWAIKRWHRRGPHSCASTPRPCPGLSLPIFYCPLLSCSLPRPHPAADRKTIAFFKPLLVFPDLLPHAQKVTLLAGLVRAWLGPQPGMVREGWGGRCGFCQCSKDPEPPSSWRKELRNPIQTDGILPTSSVLSRLQLIGLPWWRRR